MFSRRIVLHSARSQWKIACRASSSTLTSFSMIAFPTVSATRIIPTGIRGISGTSATLFEQVMVSETKAEKTAPAAAPPKDDNKVVVEACGGVKEEDDDDEDEEEEMFVEAHESFEYKTKEWGGPRRGGRLPEPTRFGDWERKGRCTDF